MIFRIGPRLRLWPLLLCCALLLSLCPPAARAVTQEEIDKLKAEVKELENEKSDYNQQLEALSDDMSAALERKALLDTNIALTMEQVEDIQAIIAYYEAELGGLEEQVAATERQLQAAREASEETYRLYCERVRALEEGGSTTYWGILFGATSYADMLSRIDFVSEVLNYNEEIIRSYAESCDRIQEAEEALRLRLAEKQDVILLNQEAKADLELRTQELERQRAEAIELVLEIDNNQSEYQDLIRALEEDEAQVEAEIKKKEAELAEQRRKEEEARRKAEEERRKAEAARNKTNSSSSSSSSSPSSSSSGSASRGFIWPVPSRRITSTFGYRTADSTNGVGSTNHKGIDIGQVYYSTTVVAAKAGRVTIATLSSSYGNYVMIDHGDGSVTVYAHMSSLKVSAGQYVSQGQAIGITGSTGHSTGPHLHFEIRINGNYVDPLKYLP